MTRPSQERGFNGRSQFSKVGLLIWVRQRPESALPGLAQRDGAVVFAEFQLLFLGLIVIGLGLAVGHSSSRGRDAAKRPGCG